MLPEMLHRMNITEGKGNKMNVLVVGCGKFGKNHIRILNELKHKVFIQDSDEEVVAEICKDEKILEYGKHDDVEAVIVTTPSNTHYDVVKYWLRKKKHVFCEKPLCFKSDQAWELIDLADSVGVFFAVGHVFRFTDGAELFKRLVNEIHPTDITMNFLNDKPPRSDSNILFNLAIHLLDMLDMVGLGKPTILDYSKDVNYGHIKLKYPHEYKRTNDIEVTINVSCNSIKERSVTLKGYNSTTKINLMTSSNEPLKDEITHFFDCIKAGVHPTNYADIKVIKLLEGFK